MGTKLAFLKVSTLSFSAYVKSDWDWLICPKRISKSASRIT